MTDGLSEASKGSGLNDTNKSIALEPVQLTLCDKQSFHRFMPMVKYKGKDKIEQFKCLFCAAQRSGEVYEKIGDAL